MDYSITLNIKLFYLHFMAQKVTMGQILDLLIRAVKALEALVAGLPQAKSTKRSEDV